MDAKSVLLCVFACVCFGGVFAQVGSLCRSNERLLSCGCPKTCRDPVPDCKGVCKEGCFCEEGEVRDDNGICVKLANCTHIPAPYKRDTTEPRLHGGDCPENEEYRFCEPCNRSCYNLNPICPAQCAKGCFCKGDLLRDKNGKCVKFEKCSNFNEYIKEREKNYVEPIPYRFSCGRNQLYKECQKCTQSCSDPEPVCGKCKTGCFCKDGFVKGPDGTCVNREDCPKAQVTLNVDHISTSIDDCSSREEFYSCGWCEPTCQDPTPACPGGCTRGCQCRPPMLRHASGECITKEQCDPQKCSSPNEEYKCLYGCERHCHTRSDYCLGRRSRRRRCALGCYCKRGLLRDQWNRCVRVDQCYNGIVIVVE